MYTTVMLLRVSCLLLGAAVAFGQTAVKNPSFEDGGVGEIPTGWHINPASTQAGFRLELTATDCYSGAQCALLTGPAKPPAEQGAFGNLIQSLAAKDFRGHSLRLKAAIRVEGGGTRAQMWIRLDGANSRFISLDNMDSRPVTSSEWKVYETDVIVPAETELLVFGVMQFGSGKAWVDDVRLEDKGEFTIEGPRTLTKVGLRNLTAFAKLYGYVRFFHPSDQAAAIDWQSFAIEGVRQVESATGDADLSKRLNTLFAGIAPTVQLFETRNGAPNLPRGLEPSAGPTPRMRYEHLGVGLVESTMAGRYQTYTSKRTRIEGDDALPDPFRAELVPGLSASVPLSLYLKDDRTLPHIVKPRQNIVALRPPADRAVRLADIVVAWNVFEHFYPYFDVVKADWPAELARAFESAATDGPDSAFAGTLKRMVAALKDGHGYVSGPGAGGSPFVAPFNMDWVRKQAIVVRVSEFAKDLAAGDRILRIDGKDVEELFAEKAQLVSAATPQYLNWRVTTDMNICDASRKIMDLEIQPVSAPDTRKTVQLLCATAARGPRESPTEARPAMTAELEPGIFYIDLERITMAAWLELLPKLEKAAGIVFDLRGYPNQVAIDVLAHLADKEIRSAKWNIPKQSTPDRTDMKFVESGWPVPPKAPHLTARAAFLTDGRAISYAETVMGIVEHFKLAQIVGQATAGTNGNVNPFKLPSGHTISWTGMKVLKHDGSRHHGIGILPTVPVERTRQGIAAGKDEILLRAVEVVKAGAPPR